MLPENGEMETLHNCQYAYGVGGRLPILKQKSFRLITCNIASVFEDEKLVLSNVIKIKLTVQYYQKKANNKISPKGN